MMQKRFPQTRWLDDSLYLTGQCYLADGKADSARLIWNSLIKRFPRSPYCDMVVADLESAVWDQPASSPRQESTQAPGSGTTFYSIQVGAFSKQENARTILTGLEKVGYEGMIVEKKVGNRLFHAVWIGTFPDRESAEDYARRFIVKVTKEYSIVKSQ